MIAKLFLGSAIAAAAIGTAAPASADADNPFSHLCMVQCSAPASAAVPHGNTSQMKAGMQQGLRDMQSALPPGH